MKKFIETLTNIWKIEELRNKIIVTLGLLLVYRFGAQVVLPGIDTDQLVQLNQNTEQGILGILNAFTGGAFANASIFALGIMPYISASIVVQLMGIAIPYLQKLDKEGESGRKTKTQITRWLTIAICIVQAPAYLYGLSALGVPDSAFVLGKGLGFMIPAVVILVTWITGTTGALTSIASSLSCKRSAAGFISAQWNGALTGNGSARLAPASFSSGRDASTASAWPAMTNCPGAL